MICIKVYRVHNNYGLFMSVSQMRDQIRRGGALPPCCLPGDPSSAAASYSPSHSLLDALSERPSALLALAAVLMLAFGAPPATAQEMTILCTPNGFKQVPVDGESQPSGNGMSGCAHACTQRDQRRGKARLRP